jgi:small subunit ribosomal protein S8
MNHKVSDFLIRIKNASLARRREVNLPYSKVNKEIGKVLVKEGFLEEIKDNKGTLVATIKYDRRSPVLSGMTVVSKPSLRIYKGTKEIAGVERKGKHTVVLTTSMGVMTGKDARKKGVGGEILFEIW